MKQRLLSKLSNNEIIEVVNDVLKYDKQTNQLYYRTHTAYKYFSKSGLTKYKNKFEGKLAEGYSIPNGYKYVAVAGLKILKHRAVWICCYKELPDEIDHIDHNKSNNCISNLRNVSHKENHKNRSGSLGQGVRKIKNRWSARIKVNQQEKYLGSFTTQAGAIAARIVGEIEYDFHENHGKC